MSEIYLVKKGIYLIPAMDSDKEEFNKLKNGETYRFKFSRPRNYPFLQKFFVMLRIVFENQNRYTDIDRFRKDLTIECGFYDLKINYFTGEQIPEAKSISFASMKESEFETFFNTFVDKIIELYGFDESGFKEEIDFQVQESIKNKQNLDA